MDPTRIVSLVKKALSGKVDVNSVLQGAPGLSWTPLMIVCQFKFFNPQFGTTWNRDTIAKLLRQGADPNFRCPENQVTAIFFAVKYTDIESVNLLIEHQADVKARDHTGRSCLKNATDVCNVEIVGRLLQLGVSGSERNDQLFKEPDRPGGTPELLATMNAAEKMLLGSDDISVRILGHPPAANLMQCFELLLRDGAELGAMPCIMISKVMRIKDNPDLGLSPRQACVALLAVGLEFPGQQRVRFKSKEAPPQKTENISHLTQAQMDRLLAGEGITDAEMRMTKSKYRDLKEHITFVFKGPSKRGAEGMNLPQLQYVAQLWNLDSSECKSRSHFETLIQSEISRRSEMCMEAHADTGFETANSASVAKDSKTRAGALLASELGPACTVVTVNQTTVVAFLSTASWFTVINTAFADRAGLSYSDLKATKPLLRDALGNELKGCRLIDSVTIKLTGGLEVTLRTAVVCDDFSRGVQLGMDFFRLSVWNQVDVLVKESEPIVQIYGGMGSENYLLRDTTQKESDVEQMHFMTEDGQISVSPIFHIDDRRISTIVPCEGVSFDFCEWCGLAFPNLMNCSVCKKVKYCSRLCQKADWPQHKKLSGH